MAALVSSRGVTNLLDYKPDPDVISQAAWKANAALTFHKLLNNLQRAATMYAVVDPKTSARTIADWALTPTFEARSAMDTYPGGQGAVNVALRKNVNKLLYTYLINLLTPYWSKIDKALNVQEYHDDASPLHVRDADGEIIERMPLVSLLIEKIKQKTFKGPVVHNRNFERHIKGFKGPKDASDTALTTITAWLDNTDTLWSMLKAYPGCLATEGQRWSEFLTEIKNWSTTDHNRFPADIFINKIEETAKSSGVESLSNLIASFSAWIEAEILKRQSSNPAKVVSVNATATGGCANHGPHAKHTTAECRGLGKRPADQQDQRGNAKSGKYMNKQQLNRGPTFTSVRFNQDKTPPGQSSSRPKYQGGFGGHRGSTKPGNGGHHGPKRQGDSLEELLMKNLSGGYKGKRFDPTKSKQYNALMTYFQSKGQSATGASPISSNGASAAGQATAAQASNNAALSASLPFAFAVMVGNDSDLDYQQEEEDLPKSTQCCEGFRMLNQEERIMNRVIEVAERVSELEELGAAQLSTDTRLPPIEYHSLYEQSLTRISDALNGFTEFDAEVTTDILEDDFAQTDNIFNNFCSGDIKDNCKRRVQARDLFGDDCTDPSECFDSDSEYGEPRFEILDPFEAGADLRPITPSYSPPSRRYTPEPSDNSEVLD